MGQLSHIHNFRIIISSTISAAGHDACDDASEKDEGRKNQHYKDSSSSRIFNAQASERARIRDHEVVIGANASATVERSNRSDEQHKGKKVRKKHFFKVRACDKEELRRYQYMTRFLLVEIFFG